MKFAESRYSIASTISDISPMRPIGWSEAKNGWIPGECIGVLIIPAETAFTRTPLLACSIARALVAAFNAPLVRDVRTPGTLLIGWATRLGETVTTGPSPARRLISTDPLRVWKQPVTFG